MIQITKKADCCGCGACANICPKNCITMKADEEGFLYPSVDKSACINCDACIRVCPVLNKANSDGQPIAAYAAISHNDKEREESSSGGIFSVLASYVLKDNGVVFGAAFDEDFNVKHIFVDKEADMYKLRGSKYLQSRTEDCYAQAKKFLNEGKKVLYSGTPCQISGLHNYLGKEYENLITVDLICHGTPSPLVWQKYLRSLQASSRRKPRRISFRHKHYGWKRFSVSIKYDDTEYLCEQGKDKFMKAFLSDMCLRPSCYECPSRGARRVSDFTIADFWGIQKIFPEMDDDRGTSLVIIHSRKGEGIFSESSNDINCKQVDFIEAIRYNPSMLRSARKPDNRKKFMRAIIKGKAFDESINKYCCLTAKEKTVKLIKRALRKVKHAIVK